MSSTFSFDYILDQSVRFLNEFYKERNLKIYTFLVILCWCDAKIIS